MTAQIELFLQSHKGFLLKNPAWVVTVEQQRQLLHKLMIDRENRRAAEAAAAEHSVAVAEHIAAGVLRRLRDNDFTAVKIAFGAVHINGKLLPHCFYNVVFIHKKSTSAFIIGRKIILRRKGFLFPHGFRCSFPEQAPASLRRARRTSR